DDVRRRRHLLTVSLVLNFGFLGFFKYFNFFTDSFAALLTTLGFENVPRSLINRLLPPGISFYTFQAVAYIVDVYHKKLEPSDSLVDYALFISLFPHLIAGPIQRPSHLLPQVQAPRSFDSDRVFSGIMLFVSGLFRKCVIADNCGLIADAVFSGKFGEPDLVIGLIGMYAFTWQIYGDFSGYSDMARGSAQLLGFHFMVNFRQPNLARTLGEVWSRWHISLSTWLRDYLYIPLGGNRHGEAKTYRNVLLTMLLGGLWHGANWTFVIWGGIHGVGLVIERFLRNIFTINDSNRHEDRIASLWSPGWWMARIFIFHFVCFTRIFFRSPSIEEAMRYIAGFGRFVWRPEYGVAFKFLAVFTIPMFVLDLALEVRDEEYLFEKRPVLYRYAVASAFSFLVLLFSANQANAFIYFQF
ncbi:MAG TPA: MBOAT family O-acyltransferase, partial [Bryobacteraceae bacterium]|nr:MBOAT family O-acyltransferase [Bryobacteraceae bacterium]